MYQGIGSGGERPEGGAYTAVYRLRARAAGKTPPLFAKYRGLPPTSYCYRASAATTARNCSLGWPAKVPELYPLRASVSGRAPPLTAQRRSCVARRSPLTAAHSVSNHSVKGRSRDSTTYFRSKTPKGRESLAIATLGPDSLPAGTSEGQINHTKVADGLACHSIRGVAPPAGKVADTLACHAIRAAGKVADTLARGWLYQLGVLTTTPR